jgi:uncharacterized protein
MALSALRLGPKLTVPTDVATESWGILGQRGSGKSNALVVLAEELYRAQVPWVAIDPKGDWWGIRSSADGKGPGLSVPVFGGDHGDLPLEPTAGKYIADLLVDQNLTAVLDVSSMTGAQMARFLTDFCRQLFQRHKAEPHVRMVLLEEAHRYIPQQVTSVTAELKEAAAKIPLEGRAFGLGSAAASQRSSRLHKDVLTQFSILAAMRSPAALDRDAILAWIIEQEVSRDVMRSLATLPSGDAWILSPHALGITERASFRQRWTFDSGATPKVGQVKRTPKTLADVDLDAVREAMAATIEKAKAEDPRELRRRIMELERQLAAAANAKAPAPVVERVEVPVLAEGARRSLRLLVEQAIGVSQEIRVAAEEVRAALERIAGVPKERAIAGDAPQTAKAPSRHPVAATLPGKVVRPSVPPTNGSTPVTGPQRRILDALAWWEAIGVARPTKLQVGMVARVPLGHRPFRQPPLGAIGRRLDRLPRQGQDRLDRRGSRSRECGAGPNDIGGAARGGPEAVARRASPPSSYASCWSRGRPT